MTWGNQAGFFQPAYARGLFWLSLGLLGGCSHAARQATPTLLTTPQTIDIGVPACNAYLNRYLACHRAANIFPADELESHYQAMLSSLQQSAADPKVRPYLPARCVGLRQELDAAVQDRSCTAPATGTPPQTGQPASIAPVRTQNGGDR
ncbi:hypothetical protein EO087_03040 [Dyella sp. M7H15-1]|uniref:hypothetical protein n=1 Tax=Dyella sp. M7H15-1 TaxID=2501295 RepID=UPI001004E591|nr:hypothetical protein [Dyella sp. M7H15-1]QAU23088.1 hypothetical protein EO087_03040 [Dyella sp. M7H15-1]